MMISVYFLIFLSLFVGALFAIAFVWSVKTNQFKDVEEPKYQMLRNKD